MSRRRGDQTFRFLWNSPEFSPFVQGFLKAIRYADLSRIRPICHGLSWFREIRLR